MLKGHANVFSILVLLMSDGTGCDLGACRLVKEWKGTFGDGVKVIGRLPIRILLSSTKCMSLLL